MQKVQNLDEADHLSFVNPLKFLELGVIFSYLKMSTFRSAGKVYLVLSIINWVLIFFSGKGHKFAKLLWN